MKIDKIDLKDFGCFQDESVDNLDSGIVLIAGPQRAGKTTFMEAVRQIPYGVKQSNDLQEPAHKYDVNTQVSFEGGRYRLTLDHFADTKITTLQGDEIDIEDIRKDVKRKQYQQLFTISLDQLKRYTGNIDDEEELAKIILGAGYGDISEIPEIKEEFRKRAYSIGRSKGKPTSKSELNDPVDKIEEGVKERTEADKQVDEYREKKGKLKEKEKTKKELEEEKKKFKLEKKRLELISTEYSDLENLTVFRRELTEEDIEWAENFPTGKEKTANTLMNNYEDFMGKTDAEKDFEKKIDAEDPKGYREKLIDRKKSIEDFKDNLSGWEEKASQIEQDRSENQKEETEIKTEIQKLRDDWDGNFEHVQSISIDQLNQQKVREAVQNYRDAIQKREEKEDELLESINILQENESKLADINVDDMSSQQNPILMFSGVASAPLIITAAGAYMEYLVPGIVVAAAALGVGLYYLSNNLEFQKTPEEVSGIKSEIGRLETDVSTKKTTVSTAIDEFLEARTELEELREQLNLPEDVPPESIEQFYSSIDDLDGRITELQNERKDVEDRKDKLENQLQQVTDLLEDFGYENIGDNVLAQIDTIATRVKELHERLELAEKVESDIDEKNSMEEEISQAVEDVEPGQDSESEVHTKLQNFIGEIQDAQDILEKEKEHEKIENRLESQFKSSEVTEAFEDVNNNNEPRLKVLISEFREFVNEEEVEEAKDSVESEIDKLDERIPEDKKIIKLEEDLDKLASDDDIMDANEQIEEGRQELQKLAEEYAVNRFAETITEELNKRFIEQKAGPLVEKATEIFREVTEEYDEISHNEDLEDLQFAAHHDLLGEQDHSQMSRATAEQLFLSVRIARIKQLDANLPVVIDDAMTNFDPDHTARMLKIIDQLAQNNQVFMLTCHPELIELAAENSEISQYLGLEEGRFTEYENEKQLINILDSTKQKNTEKIKAK